MWRRWSRATPAGPGGPAHLAPAECAGGPGCQRLRLSHLWRVGGVWGRRLEARSMRGLDSPVVVKHGDLSLRAEAPGGDSRLGPASAGTHAGVSEATVSRAMTSRGVRGTTALKLVQALRGQRPLPELERLVVLDGGLSYHEVWKRAS